MDTPQDIISRLKFAGRIKLGDKINIRGIFVQPDNVLTSISRTMWYKDNRNNAYEYLVDTTNKTYSLLTQLSKSPQSDIDKLMMQNVLSDLKQAKIGIANLCKTYADDLKFSCNMETLIQDIDSHLMQYSRILDTEHKTTDYQSNISEISSNLPGNQVNIAVSTQTGTIDVHRGQKSSNQLSQTSSIPISIFQPTSPQISSTSLSTLPLQTTTLLPTMDVEPLIMSSSPDQSQIHKKNDMSVN